MEEALRSFAHHVALAIELVAIVVIAVGCVEAVFRMLRYAFASGTTGDERRDIWLAFARWLVAGLTFQLAADVVNTSFDPGWDQLGRLAVVAVIRTFLSYFLDREVGETRERQHRIGDDASKGR